MRRLRPPPAEGLRAELAAEWRAFACRIFGADEAARRSSYWKRADALDRGEPVEVANWELPRGTLPAGALAREPYWYVIEPDGTIRPADHEGAA